MKKNAVIESVTQYVQYFETICPKTTDRKFVLIRGQRQEYEEGLVPAIARREPREKLFSETGVLSDIKNKCEPLLAVEEEIINQFRKKSLPFLELPELIPDTLLDWLALAQHHNVPTRLLDWSCNALASLWFVVDGAPARSKGGEPKHGVVYILETESRDFKRSSDPQDDSLFSGHRLFIYEPPSIARRVSAQLSYFTVHPYDARLKPPYVAIDQHKEFENRLSKLDIPHTCFEEVRADLDRLGVNRFSVYQSLDSLGDHLRWYYLASGEG